MSEDKNLNGVMDDMEFEVGVDMAKPGEAKGSETSEAASEEVSSETIADVAPAESESVEEDSSEEVVVEVEPLTVTLTFGKEVVKLFVTKNFQLDLRQACQDKNSRFDEFEVEGDLDPQNLRLLMNALK